MKQLTSVVVLACLWAGPARAGKPYEDEECLGCHAGSGNELSLKSGDTLSLDVDEQAFSASVHGARLKCSDCHQDELSEAHQGGGKEFKDKRQVALVFSDKCKRCHFKNYTQTLDGVHQALQAKGNTNAALCVDCHGSHDIARPGEPRSRISQTCAKCHKGVYDVYAQSVHGKALLEGNNDVPVCTDCHRSHDIKDPRVRSWLLATPELCGTCHTNPKLMAKYNLSPKVVSTYLTDFHGTASSLQRAGDDGAKLAAVCTDCHGVHDIKSTHGPDAASMKQNLVNVCKKCHANADASFPAAWMSHYEPSLEKTPIIYAVKLFYMFMIPFTIGGLVLQILLHLWRVVVNR
jgi:hypothetical protein